jgi:cell division protein FtsN
MSMLENTFALEMLKLKEQFKNQESEQRNELIGVVILTIIAVYIILYMERFRFQQNFTNNDTIQYETPKPLERISVTGDLHSQLLIHSKKAKKHQLKKAKSFANFNKHPVEAPL